MKEDKSYGIILILRKEGEDDKFLALLQKNGYWSFPKGHSDPGESPKEAAIRELKEEAGITEITFANLPTFSEEYVFTDRDEPCHKVVEYFVAFTNTDKVLIQQEEILEYRWAKFEEKNFFQFRNQKDILDVVKKAIDL